MFCTLKCYLILASVGGGELSDGKKGQDSGSDWPESAAEILKRPRSHSPLGFRLLQIFKTFGS